MSEGTLHIGYNEFQKLSPEEQAALKDWVKSFFDCNPDLIEWIEFPDTPDLANRAMQINLLVSERPDRPTLMSEHHLARIKAAPDKELLARFIEVTS